MRHKIGIEKTEIRIEQRALGGRAVVRFVMLESVPAHLAAERVQKVILAVMARSEERSGLSHQLAISRQILWFHRQIGFIVRDDIHNVDRLIVRGG